MMNQSPQWPDEPDQSPGSGSPLSRLARSRRELTAVAVVTGVLIVALLGMLALALSSNAHGAIAQTGQDGLNGQTRNAGGVQTTTADGAGGGTSSSGGTPTGGGGGKHATPTPTSTHGSATPTSGSITGCCLTFGPSVHQIVSQVTLSGTSVGPAVATCPSGEIALSGGWSIPPKAGALVYNSARASKGSWGIYVRHSSSVTVTAYAECLSDASGATIIERTAYQSVSPGAFDFTHTSCSAGEVLVGGGFYSQTSVVVAISEMSSASVWSGQAKNYGATSAEFGIYAECLTYANAHSSQTTEGISSTVITQGNGGRAASPPCPSATYMSGGSFNGPWGVFYDTAVEGNGGNTTWAVYDYNNNSGDDNAYLVSRAICLGF